jgi:gamma-glutamyl hercynylcysteine S-oxide synthase
MRKIACFILFIFFSQQSLPQSLDSLILESPDKPAVTGFSSGGQTFRLSSAHPLFSFLLNGRYSSITEARPLPGAGDTLRFQIDGLEIAVRATPAYSPGIRFEVVFKNATSGDTLVLENLVPLGESPSHTYITGLGKHWLSRTHLFRPRVKPVNVIVPDNAWELGYAGVETGEGQPAICALARRRSWDPALAQRRRFETYLFPGGTATYHIWFDVYDGEWQEGLRRMFQERYLYDLEGKEFDETLYRREDLQWIRRAYAMRLVMAWDHEFYDHRKGEYRLEDFLHRGRRLFGGDDVIGLWPNWPLLGLDQRNQWDLFRDLPGGTPRLRELAETARAYGTKFFISYNPWDESTRWEDHHAGMSDMIAAVGADGVVLDTEGKSSPERQQAADSVRMGVVMYSEGMAVPKDMPGIVSGRVHNALYYPPMLNLNKFIRPDFAVFRVAELFMERIRREYAVSFFNGYGTEINQFRPGRPDWVEDDYRFWGRTLMILRENSSNFTSRQYTPLIPTHRDGVYVNEWPLPRKTVYTIFSLVPEGHSGALFTTPVREGYRIVDLWNHRVVEPDTLDGRWNVPVEVEGFSAHWLGTNNEGAVGAIAVLPHLLEVSREGDFLTFSAEEGDLIRIWPGDPSYEKRAVEFLPEEQTIRLMDVFGRNEGKFVVQLFENDELLDEYVFEIPTGLARLISRTEKTAPAKSAPPGMVLIPAGTFTMKTTFGDNFIPNPEEYPEGEIHMPSFYMDKHPVTNAQFREFLEKSGYMPEDTANFLRHWKNGRIPEGQEQFPVIYVSYEDAKAYARWAGKRLPTEIEWQYAAQTPDLREWPWAKDAAVERERQVITPTLTVSRLKVDPELCNTGSGELYPVGSYPKGANPYGLEDLVGCVWQLTDDLYDNGTNYFIMLKGGSYFLPASSWWYVEGGPRELTYTQKLLRVSPGFERNGTTGFRCLRDNY